MPVSLNDFCKSLAASSIMSAGDIKAFLESFPAEKRPKYSQDLARELVRAEKITKYQAQAVYQGQTKGLVLGNYVILSKIGAGGMGEVYKAQHKVMERIVALKVLPRSAVKSEQSVQRFHREVKAAAKLFHPNIVTAFDADQASGIHFLVMEHVAGKDRAAILMAGQEIELVLWWDKSGRGFVSSTAFTQDEPTSSPIRLRVFLSIFTSPVVGTSFCCPGLRI